MTLECVVDASVVVTWLLHDGALGLESAGALRDRDLVAPQLLHFEVMQALRGVERREGASTARVELAIRALFRMPVEVHPMETLARRVWELQRNLTAYDASYVALAERLDVPLITLDRRLARAPGIRCEVIVPS